MELQGYLTVNEAGELIGVSGGRIRQFISENRLPSIKVGNLRLVKETDVKKLKDLKTGRPKDEKPSKNALAQRKYRETK